MQTLSKNCSEAEQTTPSYKSECCHTLILPVWKVSIKLQWLSWTQNKSQKTEQNNWGNCNTYSGNSFKTLTLKNCKNCNPCLQVLQEYWGKTQDKNVNFCTLWFNSNIKLPPPTAQMRYIPNFCLDTYLIHAPCIKIKCSVEIEGRASWRICRGFCEEKNGIKDWILIMEHARELTIGRIFW